MFTKVLIPIFASLREKGIICLGYMDDSLVLAQSEGECVSSIMEIKEKFEILGYKISDKKSVLNPTQRSAFFVRVFIIYIKLDFDQGKSI